MFFRKDVTLQNALGQALSGGQVYVCNQPASTSVIPPSPLATLYSDSIGTPLANPLTTDGLGSSFYYADANFYTEVYVWQGRTVKILADQNIATLNFPAGSDLSVRRVIMNGGTALNVGNFVLSAGWGNTASITAIAGYDSNWKITITSAGTGQAVNPTITLTFANGAWTNAPSGISKAMLGTGAIGTTVDALTTTQWTVTFLGFPVAGSTYVLEGLCFGK